MQELINWRALLSRGSKFIKGVLSVCPFSNGVCPNRFSQIRRRLSHLHITELNFATELLNHLIGFLLNSIERSEFKGAFVASSSETNFTSDRN